MKIIFDNNKEQSYDIQVLTKDYIIATKEYTVEDSIRDKDIWQKRFEKELNEEFKNSGYDEYCDFEDKEYDNFNEYYIDEHGEQPEVLSEDTFYYTIVDIENKLRGTDNYIFTPYNYKNTSDCFKAINKLLSKSIELSSRYSIRYENYEIIQE